MSVAEVKFYAAGEVEDSLFKYAVIVARYRGKWVFCKNKRRMWELSGGHREPGEEILETAARELREETGAAEFEISPVCAYKINNYGLLCFAEIKKMGVLPPSEIEYVDFFDDLPDELSFPLFHPRHFERVKKYLQINEREF